MPNIKIKISAKRSSDDSFLEQRSKTNATERPAVADVMKRISEEPKNAGRRATEPGSKRSVSSTFRH